MFCSAPLISSAARARCSEAAPTATASLTALALPVVIANHTANSYSTTYLSGFGHHH
jgi:hypothetical protein